MNSKSQLTNSFLAVIIGYLALPVAVFWCGWFEWWVAVVCLLATVYLFWVGYGRIVEGCILTKNIHQTSNRSGSGIRHQISYISIAFVWTYLAGVGGFRPQHFDYYKHNLILNNLVLFDWPIIYTDGHYLCYYNAYYFVPALLAKAWGGVAVVHFYMFGWAWLGLTLLFGLLHKIGGWSFVLLFMFFNSTKTILLVYEALKSPDTIMATLADLWTNDHTIELIKTPGGLTYPSHVESMTAVPQHAIAGWLATGVVVYQWSARRLLSDSHESWVMGSRLLILAALLLYWSPFVALGLLLVFGFRTIQQNISYHQDHCFDNKLYIIHHTSYIIIVAPTLLYYTGHVPMNDPQGFIINFIQTPHQYLLLATFLVIEAIFWGVLIWLIERKYGILKQNYGLVITAILILFLLPFYHYGHFNDFMRRVSLPASMVLCWGLWQLFIKIQNQKSILKYTLTACLAVASVLPIKHHLSWFTERPYMGVTNKSITDFSGQTIHYLSQYHKGEFDVTAQYLGDSSSVYWQYLRKK